MLNIFESTMDAVKRIALNCVLIMTMLMVSALAFAAEVQPVPGQSIVDAILAFIASPTGAVVGAFVVEFALRFKKSEKALGIIHLIGGCFKVFGNLLVKVGEFSDKIFPQAKK